MNVILVTGANRTGTTWMGKMLTLSGQVTQVMEPFNAAYSTPHRKDLPFKSNYRYIIPSDYKVTKRYLSRRIRESVLSTENSFLEDPVRLVKRLTKVLLNKRFILFKDPLALLSAPWIAQEYNAKVIVMIRHPLNYVASIKRLQWPMRPTIFMEQPEFMRQLDPELSTELKEFRKSMNRVKEYDLRNTAMCWKVFYHMVDVYRKKYPEWKYVIHEDISEHYLNDIREMYMYLGLSWTDSVSKRIQKYCGAENRSSPVDCTHVLKRDSRNIRRQWKKYLTDPEKNEVEKITRPVADLYYGDESWM